MALGRSAAMVSLLIQRGAMLGRSIKVFRYLPLADAISSHTGSGSGGTIGGDVGVLFNSPLRKIPKSALPRSFVVEPLLEHASKIGRGSFGAVFRCQVFGVATAVKVLRGDETLENISHVLLDDVMSLMAIQHPNLVAIMGVGEDVPAIVMEYAPFGSLKQLLVEALRRDQQLSDRVILNFCHQIALGLYYLHMSDIIHGNLKASNVLIFSGLRLKLSNFGLANVRAIYQNTGYFGNIQTLAPECYDGPHTRSSDVYSFGMVCAEIWSRGEGGLLTDVGTPMKIMQRVQNGFRPSLVHVPLNDVKILIDQCWKADPLARTDMATVQQSLGQLTLAHAVSPQEAKEIEERMAGLSSIKTRLEF